jgi:RNA polymerase sigma-70 factor (ECF subfamily)
VIRAASPEAVLEQRESIELAFVAAAQHLGPNQRAVLMLRDVLGFSAQETADMLGTSVASANSALQRARATVAEKTPSRSQQATLRLLGEPALQVLIDRWVVAWERNDVPGFAALLAEDASFAMPPLSTWYRGRDNVAEWARRYSINGQWRWKALVTRANGQPALAFYCWDDAGGAYLPFALNVLTLNGAGLVADVVAFIVRTPRTERPEDHTRFPDQPVQDAQLYARFGLPDRLAD